MSNPFEDFVSEYGQVEEKTAGFGSAVKGFGRDFGSALGYGAATAAATSAIAGVGVAAKKIYDAATKTRDFKNMMSFNPDLQEHHERDPRMFNQMFTSLRTMNPAYSKDPLIAGTYMRQMVDSPLSAGGKLTDALGTRDKFRGALDRSIEEGMGASRDRFKKIMNAPPDDNDESALFQQKRNMQEHGFREYGRGFAEGQEAGRKGPKHVVQLGLPGLGVPPKVI